MSTKSVIPIDGEQSTSDVDPINVPEAGGDASPGDFTSTLNIENFDQALSCAEKLKRANFQRGSIGAADPVLESSKLLRKLSEAFGMFFIPDVLQQLMF